MDWLKKLGGFLGGVSNQAGRTIGNVIGGANQAVQQAQRTFAQPVQRVINQFAPPPQPQRPQFQLPKVQIPQFQLPQAPKINLNDFLRAINQQGQGAATGANMAYRTITGQQLAPNQQQMVRQSPQLNQALSLGKPLAQIPKFINDVSLRNRDIQQQKLQQIKENPATFVAQNFLVNIPTLASDTSKKYLGRDIVPKLDTTKIVQDISDVLARSPLKNIPGAGVVSDVVKPIVMSLARGTDVLQNQEQYSKGLKGAGEFGVDLTNVLTSLYTGGLSTSLAKGSTAFLLTAAKLAPRLAASGAGQNILLQLSEGKKINEIDLKEVAAAAAIYTGLGVGIPGANRGAGAITSKLFGKAQPNIPLGAPQVTRTIGNDYTGPLSKMEPPKLPQVGKTAPIQAPPNTATGKTAYKTGSKDLADKLNEDLAGKTVTIRTQMGDITGKVRSNYGGKVKSTEITNTTAGKAKTHKEYVNNGGNVFIENADGSASKIPSRHIDSMDVHSDVSVTPASQVGKTLPIQAQAPVPPVAPKVPVKAAVTDQIAPGDIKISSAIDSKKLGLKVRGQEIREQFVNRFAPVEDLVSKIEKESGTALRPSKNPLSYVRQYLGGGGIANSKIDNELIPIIKQTKQFDGLREYLVAKRMNELADRGMSKRADNVLEGINKKYGAEVGNFEKIATELYAYQNKQIDELVNVGVLTREAADNIRAKNQFYVPFNRVIPELEDFAGTMPGQGIGRNANPIKAMHGSDKDIIDPIESMIRNTYDIQATVQKQKVMRSLYELAPDEFAIPAKNSMNKNRVGMFIDGQKTMLETSEPLARSLNSMAEEQMNFAVRVMSLPARALRSGATSLNVAFALPNIVRDQLSAAVNSKYGGVPIYDFVSGLASVIGKDDSYKRWITSGADQASFFAQDRTTLQRGVKDITGGLGYKAGKFVKSPLELFRVIGEFSEKGSRVGVYKRAERGAMKQFGNAEEAALAAAKESREATIDFARRGSKMKAANSLIPFLNARLQGTLKLANSFKERPVQTVAIGMAIAGLPAAALYLHNSEYPEYAEIPDYITRENFIIMTGNKETPFIKIPKGEIGKIFGNPVESFLAQLKSDDPSWKSTVASMVDSFLPVGSVEDPGKFVTDLTPTAASVPLQLIANYDTFRGMPIVSQYQKDLPAEQQFTKYNTETGKKIGAALNISPAKLEFGIAGFTGGLGRQALQLADILTGNKVAFQDLPVISRFAGQQKDLSKSASKVYEDADKAKIAKARENFAIKQALEKGDTSVLEGLDKTTATRLKRTVAENQAKDKLTPIQKALFVLPKDQLQSIKDSGQYQDDINFVEKVKDSLSTKKPTNPAEKYQVALDKYNEDKADGTVSKFENVTRIKELNTLKVGSNYSKDALDVYNLSGLQIKSLMANKEINQDLLNQVVAYGDALVNAGLIKQNKFKNKYGVVYSPGTKAKGTGGKKTISLKAPKFRKVTVTKGPRVRKAKQASFAKFRPTKSARKTIKIKA